MSVGVVLYVTAAKYCTMSTADWGSQRVSICWSDFYAAFLLGCIMGHARPTVSLSVPHGFITNWKPFCRKRCLKES